MDIHYTAMSGLIQNPKFYSPLFVCLVDQETREVEDALCVANRAICPVIRARVCSYGRLI